MPCEFPTLLIVLTIRNTMFYRPDFVNSDETGATYANFEPLNAKKIERPAAPNEQGIVTRPNAPGF